ncbi:MAG: TonB family protein [Verrucomicrobiia bacterium]
MKIESLMEVVLPEERRYLGLVLVLATAAHVAAFFVFKVPTMPVVRQPKAPMQVVLWGVEGEGAGGLDGAALRLMEVRDPRVGVLPPVESVRAFAKRLPVLRGLEEEGEVEALRPLLPMELPPYAERIKVVGARWEPVAMPVVVESPPSPRGSSWQVGGAVAERRVLRRPVLGRPEVDGPLGVTVVRIAVGREGLVVGAHVAESSGSFEVDRQGLAAVRGMTFEPVAQEGLAQGTVTLFWDYAERGGFPERGRGGP